MAVEDRPDSLELIRKIIKKGGYAFVGCDSGEKCLEKYEKEKPDLILLDIMLPGIDGFKVFDHIKKINKEQKIVFLSALDVTPKGRERLLKSGAIAYISKPFTPKELLAKVEKVLKK